MRPLKSCSTIIPADFLRRGFRDTPRGWSGQVAISGTLASVGAIGGAKAYPAVISIPDGIDRAQLRVGMPVTATVFAANAGVIGLLMPIIVWISSYTAYL
jgi:hypothetical protein